MIKNTTETGKDQLKAKAAQKKSCGQVTVEDNDLETMREFLQYCAKILKEVDHPREDLHMFLEDAALWEDRLNGVLSKDPRYDGCAKEHLVGWFFRDLYCAYDVDGWFSAVSSELDDRFPECEALRMQFRMERLTLRVTKSSKYGKLLGATAPTTQRKAKMNSRGGIRSIWTRCQFCSKVY